MKKKIPLGVLIFAGINTFIFGLLTVLISLAALCIPSVFENMQEIFKPRGTPWDTLTSPQVKMVFGIQTIIALLYFILGIGVFLRKEWARKVTVYFSFSMLIMVFFSAITQPALISQSVLNAVYPALLIVYFTQKKIEEWFVEKSL